MQNSKLNKIDILTFMCIRQPFASEISEQISTKLCVRTSFLNKNFTNFNKGAGVIE